MRILGRDFVRPRKDQLHSQRLLLILLMGCVVPVSAQEGRFGVANTHTGYQAVPWLYEIELPVVAQSEEERERVASLGLLQVLTRLTGLVSVPRTTQVNDAIENPQRFYSEFVFFNKPDEFGRPQKYLRVVYQAKAMLGLIRDAQLPVWWNKRPTIMAWVVVEQSGERQILDAASNAQLSQALKAQARARGLEFKLPLMDLTDSEAVTAGDIWGRITTTLENAAQRYDADLVLVGRIRATSEADEDRYSGDWQMWEQDESLTERFSAASARAVAQAAVMPMANRYAARYAVLPRGLQTHEIKVQGVDSAQGYARMMAFLQELEFIDALNIVAANDGLLTLHISSHAQREQLLMLLTRQRRFLQAGEMSINVDDRTRRQLGRIGTIDRSISGVDVTPSNDDFQNRRDIAGEQVQTDGELALNEVSRRSNNLASSLIWQG